MIWVSSYLKLPSCPAAFIAAATDTQLRSELKIHKRFLKKLLIWRSLATKNIFLVFIKKACNKAINIYSPPQALVGLLALAKLPVSLWSQKWALWPPLPDTCLAAPSTQRNLLLVAGWDGCKLPFQLVRWPCLPERALQHLSAARFRGTCLRNEDIWDNFPCELQLLSSLALICVTAARQAHLPLGRCDGQQRC